MALTTTGPGAANTLGATGEAWASGAPVVVIATDIPTTLRREGVYRGVLHETTDQAAMFAPVTKDTIRVTHAGDLEHAVEVGRSRRRWPRPAARCTSRCRPTCWERRPRSSPGRPPPGRCPSRPTEELERAAQILAAAKRPLVWAGGGALRSGAAEAVGALAERLAAPVITTYCARGLLAAGSPLRGRACRRTCPRRARSGTRPTSCSRSAATSTA